jgi:hypothetical protein
VWFASHDQGVFGLGLVGFDMSEMPFRAESLVADRTFVLEVIEAAESKVGWGSLGYCPHEEWVFDRLEKFRKMVRAIDVADIAAPLEDATLQTVERFDRCSWHGIYLHRHGCVICNDR